MLLMLCLNYVSTNILSITTKIYIYISDNAVSKIKRRQWHFVAFVYDNINKVGTFHVDSIYGYNNGSDFVVS